LLDLERKLIVQALERSKGTVSHAAKLLGLRRTTLVEKMRRFNMSVSDLDD
jgi:sigma-54 specific flagellar transcriptional regulator A